MVGDAESISIVEGSGFTAGSGDGWTDDRRIISGGWDASIRVWDASRPDGDELLQTIAGEATNAVHCLEMQRSLEPLGPLGGEIGSFGDGSFGDACPPPLSSSSSSFSPSSSPSSVSPPPALSPLIAVGDRRQNVRVIDLNTTDIVQSCIGHVRHLYFVLTS